MAVGLCRNDEFPEGAKVPRFDTGGMQRLGYFGLSDVRLCVCVFFFSSTLYLVLLDPVYPV